MTLVFTTTDSLVSRIIRWFTKSTVSHVTIGMNVQGVPLLLQADVGGVQVSLRSRFVRSNRVVAEYECRSIPESCLAGAERLLGERYDYVGLLGYVFVLAGRWVGKKVRNPLAEPSATVCSEFIISLDPTGIYVPEWGSMDPEATTAEDLLEVCKDRPDLFSKV